MESEAQQLLNKTLNGDANAREFLIERYQNFVFREACRVCRRRLEWGKDEELSIALIAFNEALDSYAERQGGNFEALANVVIRRRLIDYFRQNKCRTPVSTLAHEDLAVEEDWEQSEREEEVNRYRELLKTFQLDFRTVANASPKHKNTRLVLQKVAVTLAQRKELMEFLYSTGKLPRKDLCTLTGITPRVLERGRIYLIALSLLLAENDFPYLREYLDGITRKGGECG
jgi:RNA polymerase sigma factor